MLKRVQHDRLFGLLYRRTKSALSELSAYHCPALLSFQQCTRFLNDRIHALCLVGAVQGTMDVRLYTELGVLHLCIHSGAGAEAYRPSAGQFAGEGQSASATGAVAQYGYVIHTLHIAH